MRTTIVRRTGGAALVAVLALGVAAPAALADTGGKQLTKKQWIKAANKICSNTDDKIDALDEPTGDFDKGLTAAEFDALAEYAGKALDYSEDAYADLKALKPPKKDASQVKKITSALKKAIASIEDTASAAEDQDGAAAQAALNEVGTYQTDFEDAAAAYGSTCGASNA